MGAAHLCTLAPLKEANEELPVADLPPKGVSMLLSEDRRSVYLLVGSFAGPQEQVLITGRLTGREAIEEGDRSVRHSDPTKPRLQEIPQATIQVLMKNGKLGRFSNRAVGDVLSAVKDGGAGGMSLTGRSSQEMSVGLSNQDCLNVLAFRLVDLAVFRSLPQGTDVFQANRHATTLTEAQRKLLTVGEVGTMITNAKVVFNRMFGLTEEMQAAWAALFPQMQEEMVNCERYMPLLQFAWVQLILLNKLCNRFFPMATHPDVTEDIIRREFPYFRIRATDVWFVEEYNVIERTVTSDMFKAIGAQQQQGRGLPAVLPGIIPAPPAAPGAGHKRSKGVCFSFFSTTGCTRPKCKFSHKSVSTYSSAMKDKLKADITAKGMVPDATKM
jgi:hypothetical protein